MATMNLRAKAIPMPTPNRWGDNSIVLSFLYSIESDPHQPGYNPSDLDTFGRYTLIPNDFTVDTFPQFEPRPGRAFHSIKITGINLGPDHVFEREGAPILVGDIVTLTELQEERLWVSYWPFTSSEAFYFGDITYIPSDDGVVYNPIAECTIHVLTIPTSDGYNMTFGPMGNRGFPRNEITSIDITDITTPLNYYSNPNLPSWINSSLTPATIAMFINYINDIGDTTPYKIELVGPIDSRLQLYNKPIIDKQRIPVSSIKAGQFTVDFTANHSPIEMKFKFGNAFNGVFRLTPH